MIYKYVITLLHAQETGTLSLAQKWAVFGLCALLSLLAAAVVMLCAQWAIRKLRPGGKLAQKAAQRVVRFPVFWFFTAVGIYHSLAIFGLSARTMEIIRHLYMLALVLLVLRALLNGINFLNGVFRVGAKKSGNVYRILLLDLLMPLSKFLVWTVCILFLLDNIFHFKIGTLLAGAGVASMAVAFAAQSTIANLFGALTLILDRPFMVGDRIVIDGKEGVVQSLGLRSTQLLANEGIVYSIPNKIMAESPIVNVSRRPYVRYTTVLNLTYNHTPEQLAKGKEILREIIASHPLVDMEKYPPRISFENIGASSLDLQFVCWILTNDTNEFTRAKDEINFRILKAFRDNGFDFAFPTQTIKLETPSEPRA